ncbi:MAG: DEAD/DEAH box helicase family protein [Epsilonproteobacteria bacterium]|nr:DEAD/DEAH box helicase family protein [Campylobacterota bacterium]
MEENKLELMPHQQQGIVDIIEKLEKYKLAYNGWEERTGKTLPTILAANRIADGQDILVLVKSKDAIKDWEDQISEARELETINSMFIVESFRTNNKQIIGSKYGCYILDEPHLNIASYPKPSICWKTLKRGLDGNTFMIYLSATPHPNSYCQMFHQLKLSDNSVFSNYENFYKWFNDYGQIAEKFVRHGVPVKVYDDVKSPELVKRLIAPYFIHHVTREDAGYEHEPEDILHYVELSTNTKLVLNNIKDKKKRIFNLKNNGIEYQLVYDKASVRAHNLYMIENGVLKIDDNNYLTLSNREKIDYILDNFGDNENTIIMCYYTKELIKLKEAFKNATIVSSEKYAEGCDLYQFEHLIVYSQSWRPGKFVQRRARQCNMKRETPIKVHYLLVKNGVSHRVYTTLLSKKRKLNDIYQLLEVSYE